MNLKLNEIKIKSSGKDSERTTKKKKKKTNILIKKVHIFVIRTIRNIECSSHKYWLKN